PQTTKGTVTPLASLFSEEEARKAATYVLEKIREEEGRNEPSSTFRGRKRQSHQSRHEASGSAPPQRSVHQNSIFPRSFDPHQRVVGVFGRELLY
ncbi:unnamed protein product, partial [Brassica oleracea var. botrytis]